MGRRTKRTLGKHRPQKYRKKINRRGKKELTRFVNLWFRKHSIPFDPKELFNAKHE